MMRPEDLWQRPDFPYTEVPANPNIEVEADAVGFQMAQAHGFLAQVEERVFGTAAQILSAPSGPPTPRMGAQAEQYATLVQTQISRLEQAGAGTNPAGAVQLIALHLAAAKALEVAWQVRQVAALSQPKIYHFIQAQHLSTRFALTVSTPDAVRAVSLLYGLIKINRDITKLSQSIALGMNRPGAVPALRSKEMPLLRDQCASIMAPVAASLFIRQMFPGKVVRVYIPKPVLDAQYDIDLLLYVGDGGGQQLPNVALKIESDRDAPKKVEIRQILTPEQNTKLRMFQNQQGHVLARHIVRMEIVLAPSESAVTPDPYAFDVLTGTLGDKLASKASKERNRWKRSIHAWLGKK